MSKREKCALAFKILALILCGQFNIQAQSEQALKAEMLLEFHRDSIDVALAEIVPSLSECEKKVIDALRALYQGKSQTAFNNLNAIWMNSDTTRVNLDNGYVLFWRSVSAQKLGDFDSAIAGFSDIMGCEWGEDSTLYYRSNQILGNIFTYSGLFDDGEAKYFESLAYFERVGNEFLSTSLQADLASSASDRGDSERSDSLINHVLSYSRKNQFLRKELKTLNNLSSNLYSKGEYDMFETTLKEAIELSKSVQDSLIYLDLAYKSRVLNFWGELPADTLIARSKPLLSLAERSGFYRKELLMLQVLGLLHEDLGRVDLAENWYLLGLERAQEGKQWADAQRFGNLLASIYEDENRFKEMAEQLKQVRRFESKKQTKNRRQIVEVLRIDYEVEKRKKILAQTLLVNSDLENANLKKSRTIVTLVLAALFGSILFLWLFRVQKKRREAIQVELEHADERSQRQIEDLVKHHKYEKLVSRIQGEESERDRLAKDIHDGIGGSITGLAMKLEATPSIDKKQLPRNLEAFMKS